MNKMEDLGTRSDSEEIKWIFSAEVLEHLTPSRAKGISAETERRYRREGARFISNASNTLKLYPKYSHYSRSSHFMYVCMYVG